MNKIGELKIMRVIFIYMLMTLSSLLYNIEWFNQFDWGIRYDYWESNTEFLSGTIFWLNLFLFSLAPLLMTRFFQKNKVAAWVSLTMPLFWFYILLLQIVNEFLSPQSPLIDPKFTKFVDVLAIVGTVIFAIQIIALMRSIKKEKELENLSKFKERALKKLYLLNPDVNENLLKDLLGEHGEALNLLMAANLEEDNYNKQRLIKLALNEVSRSKNTLNHLQKKLLRISTFSDLRNFPAQSS